MSDGILSIVFLGIGFYAGYMVGSGKWNKPKEKPIEVSK